MSIYHKNCQPQQKERTEPRREVPLRLRPFCDCTGGCSRDCPDILERLAITVTDTTCEFASNMDKRKEKPTNEEIPGRSSLLDVVSKERDCLCCVTARAVKSTGLMGITPELNAPPEAADPKEKERNNS